MPATKNTSGTAQATMAELKTALKDSETETGATYRARESRLCLMLPGRGMHTYD